MSGPLSGYRVLELTSTVSGPVAGMILGDQGADIIKIEPPGIGDLARFMGDMRNGMPAMYAALNRNKRSLVLDFKDPADREIFLQLVPTADVLIENYRPDIVRRLGLHYEALQALNPGLVYVSISGYGQDGPYKNRRVYDPLIQATTGTAHAQGASRPANVRTIIFDKITGYTAAQAVTAALLQRARTGRGQHLPISMLASALYYQWPDVMWSHAILEDGVQSDGMLADWFDIFRTADGFASIILVTADAFEKFCSLLGLQLHQDERFSSLPARISNRDLLHPLLEDALSNWATEALCAELDALEVPAARVNSLDEVHQDPQVVAEELLAELQHPQTGRMRVARPPVQFEEHAPLPGRPAAALGEHSAEILRELGRPQADIDRIERREQQNRERMAAFNLAQAR